MNNADQPSFPFTWNQSSEFGNIPCVEPGLTKREYFAAMAMQGILANSSNANHEWYYDVIARHSLLAADALLAELSKPKEGE